MEKIGNYIKDTISNHRYGPKILEDIANILIEEYGLEDYINTVISNTYPNYYSHYQAMYVVNDKLIKYDYKNIREDFESFYRRNKAYKTNIDEIKLYNIYIILITFHEINHVRQYKISRENVYDSKHIIIKKCMDLGSKLPYDVNRLTYLKYLLFHSKMIFERHAEACALNDLLYIDSKYHFLTDEEIEFIKGMLNKILKKGYTPFTNPLKTYYSLMGSRREYKNIPLDDTQDEFTRLSLGMPKK